MTFAINFSNPSHGWLDVDFHFDERDFRFMASNVLNDPVRELAELALFIVRGPPWRSRVTFWLEPEGYELRASRDPELTLVVSYSEEAYPTLVDASVLVERVVDGSTTAAEMLRCLQAARPMFVDGSSWYSGFPEDLVLQLEQALA